MNSGSYGFGLIIASGTLSIFDYLGISVLGGAIGFTAVGIFLMVK